MSVHTVESHAHQSGHGNGHTHAHHWETSTAPLAISVGLLVFVPLTFASVFVYNNMTQAAVLGAIGALILLYGVGTWVSEALRHKNLVEGVAAIAFPMFLASEMFMFLAIFAAYWAVRLFAPEWPPVGTPAFSTVLPLVMLALMVLSSVTLTLAGRKHNEGDMAGFRSGILQTILLAGLFLLGTIYEYSHLIAAGFTPSTNVYGGAYYSLTGFHAIHVLLGIGVFLYIYIPSLSGLTNKTFILCASMFWYFLTVASLFVVSQVYFW